MGLGHANAMVRTALAGLAIVCGASTGCSSGGDTGPADGGDTDTQTESPCGIVEHSRMAFSSARAFEINHPYLFVVGAEDLAVLDVSDLSNPEVVGGSEGALDHGAASALVDQSLWVLDPPWLFSFDISSPESDPQVTAQLALDLPDVNRVVRRATALVIAEVKPFSVDSSSSAALYVVNDGSQILHQYTITDGWFTALALGNEHLYVGLERAGDDPGKALLTIDVTDPDSPSITDETATENQPTAIATDGERLCMVGGEAFEILSLDDPAAPAAQGSLGTEQVGGDRLVLEGDYAYAGSCSAIDVVGIANPEQPELIDRVDIDATSEGEDNCLTALAIGHDGAGHGFLVVGREHDISLWSLCAP